MRLPASSSANATICAASATSGGIAKIAKRSPAAPPGRGNDGGLGACRRARRCASAVGPDRAGGRRRCRPGAGSAASTATASAGGRRRTRTRRSTTTGAAERRKPRHAVGGGAQRQLALGEPGAVRGADLGLDRGLRGDGTAQRRPRARPARRCARRAAPCARPGRAPAARVPRPPAGSPKRATTVALLPIAAGRASMAIAGAAPWRSPAQQT